MLVLPGDHRLAAHKAINPRDLVGETFVTLYAQNFSLRRNCPIREGDLDYVISPQVAQTD
jgi:hypothetical protein